MKANTPMAQSQTKTVDVRDLLSKPTDSFERPKNLPLGHYHAQILNFELTQARTENKTDICRISFRVMEPAEDIVDDEDKMEILKSIDLSRRELRKDFFITPDAMYRLSNFLDDVLGAESGRSADERLPDIRGARVLIQVTERTDRNDPTIKYNDVGTVVAE